MASFVATASSSGTGCCIEMSSWLLVVVEEELLNDPNFKHRRCFLLLPAIYISGTGCRIEIEFW